MSIIELFTKAFNSNNLIEVEKLLQIDKSLTNTEILIKQYGTKAFLEYPLIYSACENNEKMLELLLQYGADPLLKIDDISKSDVFGCLDMTGNELDVLYKYVDLVVIYTNLINSKNYNSIRYMLNTYLPSENQSQKIFSGVYITILEELFIHYRKKRYRNNFLDVMCELIFKLNWEEFKMYCLMYMHIHNTHNIISEFYEDKSIKLVQYDDVIAIRLFNQYDMPITPFYLNQIIYLIKEDHYKYIHVSKQVDVIHQNVKIIDKIIITPYYEYVYTGQYSETFYNFISEIEYDLRYDNVYSGLHFSSDLKNQLECYSNYYTTNDILDVIKYYTHIGDRCIHNILRKREYLNTLEYCKYTHNDILNLLYELNNKIWESNYICNEKIDGVVLYRGTKLGNIGTQIGDEINFMETQFISFAREFDVAEEFGDIIFELHLTKDDVIIPIEELSEYQNELEWLCPLGTVFEVSARPYTLDVEDDGSFSKPIMIIPIRIKSQRFIANIDELIKK